MNSQNFHVKFSDFSYQQISGCLHRCGIPCVIGRSAYGPNIPGYRDERPTAAAVMAETPLGTPRRASKLESEAAVGESKDGGREEGDRKDEDCKTSRLLE